MVCGLASWHASTASSDENVTKPKPRDLKRVKMSQNATIHSFWPWCSKNETFHLAITRVSSVGAGPVQELIARDIFSLVLI
jgi:hypothetical protein